MTDLENSDSSHPRTSAVESQRANARPKGGRALASLAILIALLAALGAGYSYWLWWQAQQESTANEWQPALAAALDETKRARRAESAALREELERALAERDREVARLVEENARQRQALAEAVASQATNVQDSPGSWRLAEAEYLLRIANHRLLMERDAPGARHLLDLADDVLRQSQNFAYHDVRALLAEERAALAAFEGFDVQGIFLRLEALKGTLDKLPLRLPQYAASPDEEIDRDSSSPPSPSSSLSQAAAEPSSMLNTLVQRLAGLVRFRQHQGAALRPLLPPQQADYLQMNLRLALDRAQLAVLRHDVELFRTCLADARQWLVQFVDARHPASTDMAHELDDLLQANLAAELPDISRSLTRLRQLRDTAAAVPATAAVPAATDAPQ